MWSRYILIGSDVSTHADVAFEEPSVSNFIDVIVHNDRSPEEALQNFQSRALGDRAKRDNDDLWTELSFHFGELQRASKNEDATYKKVLTYHCAHVSEICDIRNRSGSLSDIKEEIIEAA